MASKKTFLKKQNLIFPIKTNIQEEGVFEFDEAELWNSCSPTKKSGSVSLFGLKRASKKVDGRVGPIGPSSLPVNIPDCPKILKEEHKQKWESDDDHHDEEEDLDFDGERDQHHRVPPHEYLARTRGASLSVHEGIGRTLKGRDLCSVRNAIWKKVGFED